MQVEESRICLSVVLPTLDRIDTALCLALRLRDLFRGISTEVIIVTPRGAPGADTREGIQILADGGRGVYRAYARGLREARGEYVWLLGDDDFPLDAAANLSGILSAGVADVIVAPVIFSSGKLYRPKHGKLGLLLRNWCQQGVIYRRTELARYRFHRRLRVQADHFVNVLLRADSSIKLRFLEVPICVFGVHGISSRGGDDSFRKLRPALAKRTLSVPAFVVFQIVSLAGMVKNKLRKVS